MLCCTALSPMELLQQVAWTAMRELAAAGKALLLPLQRSPSTVGTSLLQACDKAHRITQLMQPLCMALKRRSVWLSAAGTTRSRVRARSGSKPRVVPPCWI